MSSKAIIPCLDIRNRRVVSGISFGDLQDVGDPLELALQYEREGADELILLDISPAERGDSFCDLVRQIAEETSIPITVGGGITSCNDIEERLVAGADKVSIGTAAVLQPELIQEGARLFGSASLMAAVDVRFHPQEKDWFVYIYGGRQATSWRVVDWAIQLAEYGAGVILLTSVDRDGHQEGYDLELINNVSEALRIPVIASGGAGTLDHFTTLFTKTRAFAALAASVFHFGSLSIPHLKQSLSESGVPIRATF